MMQNKQAIYLFTLAHYKETLAKQKKITHKKPASWLSAYRQPRDRWHSADRFFGELFFTITKENNHTLQMAKKFNFTMLFSKI